MCSPNTYIGVTGLIRRSREKPEIEVLNPSQIRMEMGSDAGGTPAAKAPGGGMAP
jgi:hypothetical protein